MLGEDGVEIDDYLCNTEGIETKDYKSNAETVYFYGSDQEGIHLYDQNLNLISVFKWDDHLHEYKEAAFAYEFQNSYDILAYHDGVTVITSMKAYQQYEVSVYQKDMLIYSEVFDTMMWCKDIAVEEDGTITLILYSNESIEFVPVLYQVQVDGKALNKETIACDWYGGIIQDKIVYYQDDQLMIQ